MNPIDYIFLSVIGMAIAGVVIFFIRGKKQNKSSCGGCPYNADCINKNCK